LHLKGPSGSNPNTGGILFQYSTTTSNLAAIGLDNSSGSLAIMGGAGASIRFHTDSNLETTNERARITSGGDFCVNTTDIPNGTSIYGTAIGPATNSRAIIYQASSSTGAQTLQAYYNPNGAVGSISTSGSATAYNTSSDVRLKENIAPAENAGTIIDGIDIVQHDWKVGGHVRFGVIAQHINATYPEAVTAGDDGDEDSEIVETWGVDYSKFVPMLIKEIQSLRQRVAVLEGAE
jgi:hypothetical protein